MEKRCIFLCYARLLLDNKFFFTIRYFNNFYQNSEVKFLGFEYPQKYQSYPHNYKVDKYVDFLSKQKLSAKDYVFELFEKNDIVILCERLHPETSQWNFIYEIVSDKRFIDSVGNIFTEYGCCDKQIDVDTFLKTNYNS